MAIPVQFQQFKSAGIYRVVYDRSTVLGTEAELLRLVVGYSPKGPFNTPVYIKSVSDFKAMFGNISKTLEKRGCFFHRTCIHALEAGPILALNLKLFDGENTSKLSISNEGLAEDKISVKDLFDTTRFWKLEPSKLNSDSSYFNIAITDSKETSVSVIVKKPSDDKVKGYAVSVLEWFNGYNMDIPDYLVGHEDKLMSSFFTEVYVFKGQFTDEIVSAGNLNKYFESKKDTVKVTIYKDSEGEEVLDLSDYILIDGKYYKSTDVTPSDETKIIVKDETFELTKTEDDTYVDSDGKEYDEDDVVTVTDDAGNTKYYSIDNVDFEIIRTYTPNAGAIALIEDEKSISVTKYSVKQIIKNAFDKDIDALDALFNDPASGALAHYIGCLLPEFKDPNYGYISIDVLMNSDSDNTHLMASLNENMLYEEGGIEVVTGNYACENKENVLTYLEGYTYVSGKPAGTDIAAKKGWQASILNVLNTETGLREGLISQAEIDYRYIVDSFETYCDSKDGVKIQLSYLAKLKELCFAILNYPSVRTMVNQTDAMGGVFDVKEAIKAVMLPSEVDGASFCAFYTPLKFSDGYIDSIVPSAGLVSNLFINKYVNRYPYSIVAGPNYGNIQYQQLVGPDYNYSQEELHVIEPYGVNCMVYRPTFGTFINANQTAKQTPKSALSSINVRELVIFLQTEIGKVLQSYQWEFNNPTTRSAIKTKADLICSKAKATGGILEFLNIMDESNNTPDIIDNEMCVLSTHIEPGRGMGKMIHELTIYRTGGMSSMITEA